LLKDGNGSVCLRLDLGEDGRPEVRVEPYDRRKMDLASLLDGTLWMDFYQDCILDLVEALSAELQFLDPEELDAADAAGDALVSLQRRKFTSVLNLAIQLFKPQDGARVYLSHKEHLILRDFYLHLKELLGSKTFCALFDDHSFPPYPFKDHAKTTYFGKGLHTRVKLHPSGARLYTYGGTDNLINVYDIASGELLEIVKMPTPEGAEVQALCLSADGKLLYAAAHLKGLDTQVGTARIEAEGHRWTGSAVLCGLLIAEMEPDPKDPGLIYAIGLGAGLYNLRPEVLNDATEKPRPEPVYAFNACGHLRIDGPRAFATSNSHKQQAPARYDEVVLLNFDSDATGATNQEPSQRLALVDVQGNRVSGEDDIAISRVADGNFLYVVVDEPKVGGKQLLTFGYGRDGVMPAPTAALSLPSDTPVALEFHPGRGELLAALEEHYQLQRIAANGQRPLGPMVPVQIQPTDLAVAGDTGPVYVLNFISNTVTAIPAAEMPVGESYVKDLMAYRVDVLQSFFALLGGLLQYLKDCFCHHLLVKCPQCAEDEPIYLGVAEVRDNQVYKVCNFEKRKYVKSFPTLEYWLSMVPVLPLARYLVERACCAALPPLFRGFADNIAAPQTDTFIATLPSQGRYKAVETRQIVQGVQRTDFGAVWRDQGRSLELMSGMSLDSVLGAARSARRSGIKKQALIGAQVKDAQQELQAQRIKVTKVVDYDPVRAGASLKQYAATPQRIEPGTDVTLYQKDGKVLFYAVDQAAAPAAEAGTAGLEALAEKRAATANEVEALAQRIQGLDAQRRQELEQLEQLEARRQAIRADMLEMDRELARMDAMRTELRLAVAKDRPVKDVAGVDEETDAKLREVGIRTVEELANTGPDKLARDLGLSRTVTRKIVQEARTKIELKQED
jgi:hypothetical protein